MTSRKKGPLVIIGGREEKDDDQERAILQEIVEMIRARGSLLVIVTVATTLPEEVANDYIRVFRSLGVKRLAVLDIRRRDQAHDPTVLAILKEATALFFTGGDQLRITSQIGDTPLYERMMEIHLEGGLIAGTSAGAAALPETMIFAGSNDQSATISAMGMAPGLGVVKGVVIDSHFAERGRFGRLLGCIAQNPKNLGIGIDENTAIVIENDRNFRVIGSGAVYVMDGTQIGYSSLSDRNPEGIVTICNATLHVLGRGDRFDLLHKLPLPGGDEVGDLPANGAPAGRTVPG
jgi:cyanophycinase